MLVAGMGCGRLVKKQWEKPCFLHPLHETYQFVRIPSGRVTFGSREADPASPPKKVEVDAFWLMNCEVTVNQYVEFLNDQHTEPVLTTLQLVWKDGHAQPRPGKGREPISYVSYDDAQTFCQWLSVKTRCVMRLPSEEEWEYAARGGIRKARYPWGWGEPYGRARYASSGPREVGSYKKNPFGLYDMAGNVFEWCVAETPALSAGRAMARGGSWAEKNPRMLRVYTRSLFPQTYRDADVGFRIATDNPGIQIPE